MSPIEGFQRDLPGVRLTFSGDIRVLRLRETVNSLPFTRQQFQTGALFLTDIFQPADKFT